MKTWFHRSVFWRFLAAGLLFAFCGVLAKGVWGLWQDQKKLESEGILTEGVVVGLIKEHTKLKVRSRQVVRWEHPDPVVQFQTRDGDTIKARVYTHVSYELKKGDRVSLRYNPDHPKHVKVEAAEHGQNLLMIAGMFCFLFVISLVLGIAAFRSGRTKLRALRNPEQSQDP